MARMEEEKEEGVFVEVFLDLRAGNGGANGKAS